MALLIYYVKTRETDATVEYRYGPHATAADTRLVLVNADSTTPPIVGTGDPGCQHVVRRVRRERAELACWPESGVIRS